MWVAKVFTAPGQSLTWRLWESSSGPRLRQCMIAWLEVEGPVVLCISQIKAWPKWNFIRVCSRTFAPYMSKIYEHGSYLMVKSSLIIKTSWCCICFIVAVQTKYISEHAYTEPTIRYFFHEEWTSFQFMFCIRFSKFCTLEHLFCRCSYCIQMRWVLLRLYKGQENQLHAITVDCRCIIGVLRELNHIEDHWSDSVTDFFEKDRKEKKKQKKHKKQKEEIIQYQMAQQCSTSDEPTSHSFLSCFEEVSHSSCVLRFWSCIFGGSLAWNLFFER